MSIEASFQPHYHQEFQFSDKAESKGCCCFWKSKPAKEYIVDEKNRLKAVQKANYKERIEANQRLAKIISKKFDDDPIDNNKAFEMLKLRINDDLSNGDPITSERLAKIINAIDEMKRELNTRVDEKLHYI